MSQDYYYADYNIALNILHVHIALSIDFAFDCNVYLRIQKTVMALYAMSSKIVS